jgi:hypothetical protein
LFGSRAARCSSASIGLVELTLAVVEAGQLHVTSRIVRLDILAMDQHLLGLRIRARVFVKLRQGVVIGRINWSGLNHPLNDRLGLPGSLSLVGAIR